MVRKWSNHVNISLSPRFEDLVKSKVASDLCGSASEVRREAPRPLEERDRIRAVRLEGLRARIRDGIDSSEPAALDIEGGKSRGRKRLAAEREKSSV
jgi:antitoxin ParD1/3/4